MTGVSRLLPRSFNLGIVIADSFPASLGCVKRCPDGFTVGNTDNLLEFLEYEGLPDVYEHLLGGNKARYCLPI